MSNGESSVRYYVSLYRLARELGMHPNSIKNRVRDGEFPKPQLISGKLYFARDRVQEHLQKLEREGRSLRRRRPKRTDMIDEVSIIEEAV